MKTMNDNTYVNKIISEKRHKKKKLNKSFSSHSKNLEINERVLARREREL